MTDRRPFAASIAARGDAPCLIDAASGRTLSYAETHAAALGAAARLRDAGAGPGQAVAFALPNSVQLAVLELGVLYAGAVAVPLGAQLARRELRWVLERIRPALVVADAGSREREVAAECGLAGAELGDLDPAGADPDQEPEAGGEPVSIHFTSGTTGRPRGVVHGLAAFTGNGERYAAAAGLDASCRFHHALPMTYMAGYFNLLLLPLTIGASVVVDRAFDAAAALRFWEAPAEHGADVLWLVPSIMAMLLRIDRGDAGERHCRERVRLAACGTAPLDAELRARFEERYGVQAHNSYGLSETLLLTASTPAAPAEGDACGYPLPGVELELREAPGLGEAQGRVVVRTPDAFLGYLDEDAAGLDTVVDPREDGWLDTGDLGTLDKSGSLRITGRMKEIVIRGGVNVAAPEVEQALSGAAGVERLAAIGIPHELLGEEVAVVVDTAAGASFAEVEQELRRLASERLSALQRPGVYMQMDSLPVGATGKVRKGILRDKVIDVLGLPGSTKGFARDEGGDGPAAAPRIVDLTHRVRPGMMTFPSPNHPEVEVTELARHESEGRATRRLVLGTHSGTHMDAPLHFIPGGGSAEALDLDVLVGRAAVVDLSDVGPEEPVSRELLAERAGGGLSEPRVLLRFGWSERYGTPDFYPRSPYLEEDACRWLLDEGVRLIGLDTPSPDDPRNGFGAARDSPNHHLLLGAGVVLVEYLANLEALASPVVLLIALPLPVEGGDGAPARVVALDPAP